MARSESYRASDIEVLEGLEPVRKRPGMYIGGTEGLAGLHHLVKELLDNSVDEAMNGHAARIVLTLHADGESVSVEDDGRGIPVDTHPKFKRSALELVFTTLHSGGKFSDKNYLSAGGLHGVGASVVNALSEKLSVWVCRDGYEWFQEYSRGKPLANVKKGRKTNEHGTRVQFRPDPEIFRQVKFSSEKLEHSLEEKAFLNKGLTFIYVDEAAETEKKFCFADGLKAYLKSLLERQESSALSGESFYLERANGIRIETAFAWTDATNEKILSYVNGIHTSEGGSHEDGFKSGLAKAIRNYMSVHELAPRNLKIGGEDIREGLVGVVSVNVPGSVSQLQFQGQTKNRLNNPEVEGPVDGLLRSFENTLNSMPQVAAAVVQRIIRAAQARSAARVAADAVTRKIGISHRLNLPGKLADCSSNRPDKSELFIVEGDSAGGSAKQGRDRETQAVLPLRGKVLNAIAAGQTKLKDNKELFDLVSALGCGYGDQVRLERLRYGKVIILTDADADGMHIASLLMAFFFKTMKPLIEGGHLFLGLSPLYRIKIGSGSKEQLHWVYTDQEKDELLKKLGKPSAHITRFKGLGEMNPKTLWETTLSPRTRNILRVNIDDETEVSRTLESLLGRDSTERYRLIQENAERLEIDV